MVQKLITFVVPCYNSQDYMHICIDSLLHGSDNVEILIINDGSTDHTAEIAANYAQRFPDIVRVLTQENGGHGAGINHGLKEASGIYFKVVDSDDWLEPDALTTVLQLLKDFEKNGGIDLMICNYLYAHHNPQLDHIIDYQHALPQNCIFTWKQTKHFLPWQYLTLHSCIHRTQILRDSKLELPKHVFYEDNLFVYLPLPYIKRMYYANVTLYYYLIGRNNQSVSQNLLKKRCSHQILVSSKIFKAYHLANIKKSNPKLARYMYHEIVFMMALATVFTRLNRTKESEVWVYNMWQDVAAFDQKLAHRVHYCSLTAVVNLPGSIGRELGLFFYWLAHKIIAFN